MSYDTGIANRLRAAGLRVTECSGWQSRGSSSFTPRGSVNHHTAGPSSGATPSLNTCINGRSDLAGPLCNVMQSREPDGNDIAYVVAAGRANHAGEGGWQGLSGNSSVYGLEVEHTGTSALPQGRIDISAAIHRAMFGGDVSYVCQHYEWASGRKIDAATNVPGDDFRNRVAHGRAPEPPPDDLPPWELYDDGDDDMVMMYAPGKTARLLTSVHATTISSGTDQQVLIARFGRIDVSAATYDAIMGGLASPMPVNPS
jgi:hypothetical protein